MLLMFVTPAGAERSSPGRMTAPAGCARTCSQAPSDDVSADCEEASMNAPASAPATVGLTAATPDGATVAPGDEILFRVTWDRNRWSGPELDRALGCVRVKGAMAPDLSTEEESVPNNGVFEFRLHVPDDIRPGCDICAQAFIAGTGADGGPQEMPTGRRCFMSGSPRPAAPPAKSSARAPATTPTTVAVVPVRRPAQLPTEVAGVTASAPGVPARPATAAAPAPNPQPAVAPAAELPRTGAASRAGTAGGGLALMFGGLAVIGGSGRRRPHRTAA
jgi:hypothetical protein